MKICSLMLLPLLFAPIVYGQANPGSVVADTLDWKLYFPLQVGNVWEYVVTEPTSELRREIIGDTLASGHRYFLMSETWQGATILPVDTIFVRYDKAGVVVIVEAIEEDTAAVPRRFPIGEGDNDNFLEYFDLRASFGDTLFFDAQEQEPYWVSGGFEEGVRINGDSVEVAALKCLHRLWWFECYGTDIGFVKGGSLLFYRLVYARIGGREYGASLFTAVEPEVDLSRQFLIKAVYPNPFTDEATVVYEVAGSERVTIELFDLLGRKLRSEVLPYQWTGRQQYLLKAGDLASGMYIIRAISGKREQSVRLITKRK